MSLPKVVITHWVHPEVIACLEGKAEVIWNQTRDSWADEELLGYCRDADALMAFMPDSVDEDFLAACPKLKVIAAALKGYDNFDVSACTRRGVWFSIVPDLLTVPTAELTIGLMIAAGRHFRQGDLQVRNGHFPGWRPVLYGTGLSGRTVGIIGFGAVGRAISKRLQAFDMNCLFHDPCYATGDRIDGARCVDMDVLLAESDYLVPMVPLTEKTRHLINSITLLRCRRGVILVNTGRGSAVDEQAVLAALESGLLGGYAADVFEMEDWARADRPRSIDRALREHPATIFTPHLGSAVDTIRRDIALSAAQNIVDVLEGRAPRDAVNAVFPERHDLARARSQ